MTLTQTHGADRSYRTFSGRQLYVNLDDSPFGERWSLEGLSQLFFDAAGGTITLLSGAASAVRFSDDGYGTYTSLVRPETTIIDSGGGWTVSHKTGAYDQYDYGGNLLSQTDTNGNTNSFFWTGGLLDSITDRLGRAVSFVYTAGLVSAITDWTGRTTSFTHAGGRLTSITLPDPDGSGGGQPPVHSFTYNAASGLLISETDPLGNTTTFAHDHAGRVKSITLPRGGVIQVSPVAVQGLPDVAAGQGTQAAPAPLTSRSAALGSRTAPTGGVSRIESDYRGLTTREIDELGRETVTVRNAAGSPLTVTRPDPDGAGPLGPLLTSFTYDVFNNLTGVTFPDGTTQGWTYDATFHVVDSFTDELGDTTYFTIDQSTGNVLAVTRDSVTIASYTYTPPPMYWGDLPGGLLATETDALGRLTEYEHESYFYSPAFGQLTGVTYASGSPGQAEWSFEYDSFGRKNAAIDPLGRRTESDFDNLDRLTTLTLPDPDGGGGLPSPVYSWTYDAASQLTGEVDPLGRTTSYLYDADGNLAFRFLPGGADYAFGHDLFGRLVTETNPLGHVTSYTHDAVGNVLTMTLPDPDGFGPLAAPLYQFSYDGADNLSTETDPLGNVTSRRYDARSRLLELTLPDPDGAGPLAAPIYAYGYDLTGRLTGETDPLGRVTEWQFDARGRLTRTLLPALAAEQVTPEINFAYDDADNLTSVTDVMGNVTGYGYDDLDRVIQTTLADPDGGGGLQSPVFSRTYNAASELVSETGPLGAVTGYLYDGLGRLKTLIQPDPDGSGGLQSPVFSYSYDAAGRLTAETDPLGHVTSFGYSPRGDLISVARPDGSVVQSTYNAAGLLVAETDPLGRRTDYQRDALGRVFQTLLPDPDGGGPLARPVTSTAYDAVGSIVSVTDPLGAVTTFTHDALHRRTSVTQPDPDGAGPLAAPVTSFQYDAVGSMTALIDPAGNTTSWAFDELNRTTSETNALNDTRYFQHDLAGNLTKRTDRNGREIELAYDNLYRQIGETWKENGQTVNTLAFTHDAASNLTAAGDDFSSYTFTLDALGRATQIAADNPGAPEVVLDQVFNKLGARTSLAASYDDGGGFVNDFINSYTRDSMQRVSRLEQTSQSGGNAVAEKAVDLHYNAAGQLYVMQRYDDLFTTQFLAISNFGFDGMGRLTDQTHTSDIGDTLGDFDFTYDAASRLTNSAATFFYLLGVPAESSTYSYDTTNQLTFTDHTHQPDEGYSFDENGNRTMSGHVTGANNLTLSDGIFNYEYDAEGNRTRRVRMSTDPAADHETLYEYDHQNRLTGLTYKDENGVVTKDIAYVYDVFGRRIAKRIDADGDGTFESETHYAYDGQDIILAFDGAGSLTNRYLHGPGIDQILADEQVSSPSSPGETYWALADNLGSIRDLVHRDASGAIVVASHLTYDSFGNITARRTPRWSTFTPSPAANGTPSPTSSSTAPATTTPPLGVGSAKTPSASPPAISTWRGMLGTIRSTSPIRADYKKSQSHYPRPQRLHQAIRQLLERRRRARRHKPREQLTLPPFPSWDYGLMLGFASVP